MLPEQLGPEERSRGAVASRHSLCCICSPGSTGSLCSLYFRQAASQEDGLPWVHRHPQPQHYQQDRQARRYPSRQGVLVRTFLIHNCSEIRYALTAVGSLCSQGTGFLLPQLAGGWSSWGSQSTGPCLRWSALYLLRWESGDTCFYRSLLWGQPVRKRLHLF